MTRRANAPNESGDSGSDAGHDARPPRQVLRIVALLVLAAGAALEWISCLPDVLRDGQQPIAGMIALIGLFALGAGLAGWLGCGQNVTERARVWFCVVFEHLTLSAIGGGTWVAVTRNTFFAESPTGETLFGIQRVLLAVLVGITLFSMIARIWFTFTVPAVQSLRRRVLPVSVLSLAGFGLALAFLTVLNLKTRREIINVEGSMKISVVSQGTPATWTRRIEIVPVAGDPSLLQDTTVSLPGGIVQRDTTGKITVTQRCLRSHIILPGTDFATLRDGSSVRFNRDELTIISSGGLFIKANAAARTAVFAGAMNYVRHRFAIMWNALFAMIVAAHTSITFERLRRAGCC